MNGLSPFPEITECFYRIACIPGKVHDLGGSDLLSIDLGEVDLQENDIEIIFPFFFFFFL